ncbi:MAG: hypothetical protein U0836_10315 [Pirellulales bacterium]
MDRRKCLHVFALTLFAFPSLFHSAPDCCNHCGNKCKVKKVCRLECTEKEVKETKYTCECEDFCVPGKSKKCGCTYTPTCGCVYTRKKLVKKEETKKVPSTKCVVEYLCESCCASCGCQ